MPRYLQTPNELVPETPAVLEDARFYAMVFLARADRLEAWCNTWLNVPGSQTHFRPLQVLGYSVVMATFVDIGKATPSNTDLGWTTEHDLAFWVPLQEGDTVQALPAAWAVPFLYVDQPHGVAMGREIYGLPKYPATFQLTGAGSWPDVLEARTWAPDKETGEWKNGYPLLGLHRPPFTSTLHDLLSALLHDDEIIINGERTPARGLFPGIPDPEEVLTRLDPHPC